MKTKSRNHSGIGMLYKPVLKANIEANNTSFFIACGVHGMGPMQSAVSAYLNDLYGADVWGTCITKVPGHIYVYKK